jgi:hypothetical protein
VDGCIPLENVAIIFQLGIVALQNYQFL